MIYHFDRYVNGQRMAQGATVNKATSREEALKIAHDLFARDARPGEMEKTEFVLIDTHE